MFLSCCFFNLKFTDLANRLIYTAIRDNNICHVDSKYLYQYIYVYVYVWGCEYTLCIKVFCNVYCFSVLYDLYFYN